MNSSSLIAVVTEGVEGAAVAGVETFFSCLVSGSGSAAFLFLDISTVVKAGVGGGTTVAWVRPNNAGGTQHWLIVKVVCRALNRALKKVGFCERVGRDKK